MAEGVASGCEGEVERYAERHDRIAQECEGIALSARLIRRTSFALIGSLDESVSCCASTHAAPNEPSAS
jgi:hypothetical protein